MLLGQHSRDHLRLLTVVSASVGFAIGLFWKGTWQANLESAQVLAGIVEYPSDNAFYYYHLKLWTLLSQFPAVLLKLGMDERILSLILSGSLGAVSFLGLSLCTFALCRNVALSILSPVFLLALFLGGGPDSPVYPIFLMGTHHTFGVAGRGIALLTLALFGTGRLRGALFLLGLAPAIHPTWGAWCVGVAFISLAWGGFLTHRNLKLYGPWLMAGVAISCCSFFYQLHLARNLPSVSPEEQSLYLKAILDSFDVHRGPVPFFHPGVYLTIFSIFISLLMLSCYRKDFDVYGSFLLRAMVVTGTLSLVGIALTWFPNKLPEILVKCMPGRFINLSVLASSALILGLMGRYWHVPFVRTLTALHLLYAPFNWFIVPHLTENKYGWRLEHWREFVLVGVGLLGLQIMHTVFSKGGREDHSGGNEARSGMRLNSGLYAVLVLMLIALGLLPLLQKSPNNPLFTPSRSDALIAASKGEGILITAAGMELMQLRTRRPLMLNIASLDQVSIFPASGALANPALKGVYGIDLLGATEASLKKVNTLWESRALSEWQDIREKFGATDVLVWSDYRLQLPRTASDDRFALYHIPESIGGASDVLRLTATPTPSIFLRPPDMSAALGGVLEERE